MRYTLEYQTGWHQTRYGKKPEWRVFMNLDDKQKALTAAKKNPKGSRVRVYDNKLKKTIAIFGDFMESKEAKIRQVIRELIEDELEEITTTASAGSFNTPFAFTGHKKQNEKKRRSTATQAGYELSDESGEDEDNTIFEGGDPYYSWRNEEERTSRQKIGEALRNVKRSIKEANKVINRCSRLKTEMGMSSADLWKNTEKDVLKVEKALHEMSVKVRKLRG